MNKDYLAEIDSRIRLCLELEDKLNYLDLLLKDKKIGKLEYDLLKQGILENKSEEEVRREINNYIEQAVTLKRTLRHEDHMLKIRVSIALIILFLVFLLIIKSPTVTGLFTLDKEHDTENNTHTADNSNLKSIFINDFNKETDINKLFHFSIPNLK